MSTNTKQAGLQVIGKVTEEYAEILTNEALAFVEKLIENFDGRRKELLAKRQVRQAEIDKGIMPDFLPETESIRNGNWTIAPLPNDLQDRRVEITGPVDRKMVINALNSGAKSFMADFEDATTPSWDNCIQGQINLRDAVNRTISFEDPRNGKKYELKDEIATLVVRARGWHLEEKHVLYNGEPISGGIFDFGLYFFHNVKTLLEKGSGPYFYLPKIESHLEARLWNDVFVMAQNELGIPQGTIKATVLIETVLAAFETEEILYELREHSAGLNCGRWDYIFSFIKRFRNVPHVILPDRSQVTMTVPCMRSYTLHTIKTCHKRNAPAMGGMAAQIPVKDDPIANEEAFQKVSADKEREAKDGHDGTWVAHPGLVPVAMEQFNKYMPTPNQIDKKRDDVQVVAADLLEVPTGTVTEEGLRTNISVGIQYIEFWLRGHGAAPINNLMEDAATAEISRAQVWQWIRHPEGKLDNGTEITLDYCLQIQEEELQKIKEKVGEENYNNGKFAEASRLFRQLIEEDEFEEFLTIPGYNMI